ncbi:hypothetical protein ACFXKD_09160 [Nocardiopsis aegyptia]|uniref:hypothetical protein n=1 Tax=Nocardiopsis aegyptia TaxID=220378 RepID=UPI00366E0C1F
MLFLLPVWAIARIVELAAAGVPSSTDVQTVLLVAWLLAPGAFALVCGLRLRRAGPALLSTIATFAAAVLPLQIVTFLLQVPFLHGLFTALAVAVPLLFPSVWRHARANRHERDLP